MEYSIKPIKDIVFVIANCILLNPTMRFFPYASPSQ